jgi:excisionase family DNA binding protein
VGDFVGVKKLLEKKQLGDLWTIEDLQKYLKLPRSTTYLLVADGTIPHVKLGKHRRFIPDEVETALRKLPK